MIRSRVTLATTEAAAIEKLNASPLTTVLTGQDSGRDIAVDQGDVGGQAQRGNGAGHRAQTGAQDVDPVDLADAGGAHADFGAGEQRAAADLARLAGQYLRIVELAAQQAAEAAAVEDHRGGDHRPGERA